MNEINTKQCGQCNQIKNADQFAKRKMSKDGLAATCKECAKAYLQKYYVENKSEHQKRSAEYREKNKEKIKQQKHEYIKNNPEKLKKNLESLKKWNENNPNKSKEARKKASDKFRKENPELISVRKKIHYYSNREKILSRNKDYYEKNKETINLNNNEYVKNNPEIRKVCKANHKAKKLGIKGRLTVLQLRKKLHSQKFKCYYCNVDLVDNNYQIDHMISFDKYGTNYIANVVATCTTCNLRKSKKTDEEFQNVLIAESENKKICRVCKLSKSIDNFHKKSNAKDGLRIECKSCRSQLAKEFWASRKET